MSRVDRFFKVSSAEYENYMRAEWQNYINDPSRSQEAFAALDGLVVERVLDIGCGGGQELIPFLASPTAFGVGVDVVQETGRVGRELFSTRAEGQRVAFGRAAAEALPFRSETFDVAICRLALPYTENDRALEEIGRVLRPRGVLLLKIQHITFYLQKIGYGFRNGDARCVIHSLRVLTSGVVYHATSRQPRTRLTGGETFQTRGLLSRKLAQFGMFIAGELSDSNTATPSYIIKKLPRDGDSSANKGIGTRQNSDDA